MFQQLAVDWELLETREFINRTDTSKLGSTRVNNTDTSLTTELLATNGLTLLTHLG